MGAFPEALGIQLVRASCPQEKLQIPGGHGGTFLGCLRRIQHSNTHLVAFSPSSSSPPRVVYEDLVAKGVIIPAQEVPPPTVPMDYSWARVRMAWEWWWLALDWAQSSRNPTHPN